MVLPRISVGSVRSVVADGADTVGVVVEVAGELMGWYDGRPFGSARSPTGLESD